MSSARFGRCSSVSLESLRRVRGDDCIRTILAGLIVVLGVSASTSVSLADDAVPTPKAAKETPEEQAAREKRERYLAWMKDYAKETAVFLPAKDGSQPLQAVAVEHPVFRYSDQEHRIPDATLWVWTHQGRPVAFQKVEGNNWGGGRAWTICFASFSEELLTVKWPANREHVMTKPGLRFQAVPDADAPAQNPQARKLQIRAIQERFQARLGNSNGSSEAEARTLPKPIFEYADPKSMLPMGAVYGMTSTGTNPNVLLVIEARTDATGQSRWEYAHARMTGSSVKLQYRDEVLVSEKGTGSGDFGNWLYFFLPRSFE